MEQLQKADPELPAEYTPEWEYDIYQNLYFDFELSPNELVGMMIQALLYSAEWITAKEMIKIAESLQRLN